MEATYSQSSSEEHWDGMEQNKTSNNGALKVRAAGSIQVEKVKMTNSEVLLSVSQIRQVSYHNSVRVNAFLKNRLACVSQ